MDRILVLWKKDGDVYRAYAPRYPHCTAIVFVSRNSLLALPGL
jgi:hypothetical protein